jgi:Holliday junction resolvase RusA-like endonuclease
MEADKTLSGDMENRGVEHTFRIEGTHWKENCLPSLNDVLSEATRHPMAYHRLKVSMEKIVISAIRRDLCGYKAQSRVRLYILWGERKKGVKRDFDNITGGGKKIINDALVKSGVIKDDNPKYLLPSKDQFVYTDKPFIEVIIREE